jgi:hypothetical protein
VRIANHGTAPADVAHHESVALPSEEQHFEQQVVREGIAQVGLLHGPCRCLCFKNLVFSTEMTSGLSWGVLKSQPEISIF